MSSTVATLSLSLSPHPCKVNRLPLSLCLGENAALQSTLAHKLILSHKLILAPFLSLPLCAFLTRQSNTKWT